jgi:transposase
MFISRNTSKHKSGKVYHSVLLRESYREGKIVRKRTIANLSHLSEDMINAIEATLKNKKTSAQLPLEEFNLIQGRSIGGIYVLHSVAKQLGIVDALGTSFHAQLALWLIYSRILAQGSRLSATRLDNQYDLATVIGLKRGFDENNLYDTLHWLSDKQTNIEDYLFNRKRKGQKFYWYDVTSSYFEGIYNELSAFGYNRDKKKGKRIIVVGLLCQDGGDPISIEGYKGNTQDVETFESQLLKLKKRFGCESVTLICDRGLIKEKQKKLLHDYGFHYITALTLPQVTALLNSGKIKIEDFTSEMKSITLANKRHIYRRNPERALESSNQRQDRLKSAQEKVNQKNLYLSQHPKASVEAAKRKIDQILTQYCLSDWVTATMQDKVIVLCVNNEQLALKAKLDGCYIWTTDLTEEKLSTKEIYDRYKDLKYVEDDFRSFKSNFLEMRPFFVRNVDSTRGHLLVTMLAHLIVRRLRMAWSHLDKSVEEALNELGLLCQNLMQFSDGRKTAYIPMPNEGMKQLLAALNIVLPRSIEGVAVPVVTRTKIRKS